MATARSVQTGLKQAAMMKDLSDAVDIDQIVSAILADLSLKEKSIIARMDEKSIPYMQYAFDVYISRRIGEDSEKGRKVMQRIWKKLQSTHRIRLIRQPCKMK